MKDCRRLLRQARHAGHKGANRHLPCQYLQKLRKRDTARRKALTKADAAGRGSAFSFSGFPCAETAWVVIGAVFKAAHTHSAASWSKTGNELHFKLGIGIFGVAHKSCSHCSLSFLLSFICGSLPADNKKERLDFRKLRRTEPFSSISLFLRAARYMGKGQADLFSACPLFFLCFFSFHLPNPPCHL